jgi:phosphate transport system permease protein
MSDKAFSGWKRARTTRLSVRLSEAFSRLIITVGGIGTILAVALIMVFLVSVVLPLFTGARIDAAGSAPIAERDARPTKLAVDEYQSLAAVVDEVGNLVVRRLDTGRILEERGLFDAPPTAQAWLVDGHAAAFGFADGTVRMAAFGYEATYLDDAESERYADLADGAIATDDAVPGAILQRTPGGQIRRQSYQVDVGEPIAVADVGIALLDRSGSGARTVLCALTDDGALSLFELSERTNLLTGKTTYKTARFELPFAPPADLGRPLALCLAGRGDQVLVIWRGGEALRIDARDPAAPKVAEHLDLVPAPGATVTALEFLLGRGTLVVGDSAGGVSGWFAIKPEDATTIDGAVLERVHALSARGAAVTAIAPSARSRMVAVGRADGALELYQMTTEALLARAAVDGAPNVGIEALDLLPKEDGLACLAGGRLNLFALEAGYPEAGLAALFAPVWYEGHSTPEHSWESSGGSDDFEPKLGIVPLIFGTLKATFYSLLFGAPIALLAAIYTSEFLSRKLRTPVKSTIEIMASLPSVVLGFLAALVIAPFVQSVLPAALGLFVTVPVLLLVGAHLWQLMPRSVALRFEGWPRLIVITLVLAASVWAAAAVGPLIEIAFFAGDAELWLDGQVGTGSGGWFFLLMPAAILAVALGFGSFLNPILRVKSANWTHSQSAAAAFVKLFAGGAAAVALALAVSFALTSAGLDPRHDFFGVIGTYVQRNALIVGFVMGFAIIPIIYTLAEDALSSVPEHLRLASYGAGATAWQTAVRVVVPTAMSGLFSALMIGLGRAVGETMIVLMATGNTAVMDMNVFNGFRTLSANIAVELPEAVKDSTHYRTLFLAALVLFAMTFCLNTLAELVRQRFRKRAVQL